jgi:ABC-2 type transport system ATP-binding protein
MAPVLHFDCVTKEYRSVWKRRTVCALDEFSLDVEAGEIFGFLGRNGAGKSTALHLAMGFMRSTWGSGTMLGQAFGHAHTRRRVGFLAENVALHHLSARQVLWFYGALNGMRDHALKQRVRDVLELLELTPEAHRSVGKFSRGMQQRVGVAQALINDPELLLLDEPTSALDPPGRVAVRELLLAARQAGKTVFLSSHLLSEVEAVCDRVAILHEGRLRRLGRMSELLESSNESEIVARGVPPTAWEEASRVDGEVRFTVKSPSLRRAIETVWSLGGEVVSVTPVRRSLEEIFLELTATEPPTEERRPAKTE